MKKMFGVGLVLGLILIMSVAVLAARLPTVNGDNNQWGTVLNEYLEVAHDTAGNLKNSYITSAMIVDAVVAAADLASSSVNSTHIVDATIGAIDIASSVINTTHIVDGTLTGVDVASNTGFNASFIIVSLNRTSGPETNITGIYVNSSYLNLPSIGVASCQTVPINMTGLPGGVLCFATFDVGLNVAVNLSVVGVNSTQGNCRLRVCNTGGINAVDPDNALYGAMAVVTSTALS